MEKLTSYLILHKAKPLAELVGISAAFMSDLKRGHRTPSLRVALAIEKATDGAVPVTAWAVK